MQNTPPKDLDRPYHGLERASRCGMDRLTCSARTGGPEEKTLAMHKALGEMVDQESRVRCRGCSLVNVRLPVASRSPGGQQNGPQGQ